jgi:nitroimidazol reductase NimA-like FMN-containing flavoprotein (pyridoxamine 5'-phosphate oxidase superfamily)
MTHCHDDRRPGAIGGPGPKVVRTMMEPTLEELTLDECMQLLRIGTVGRIAFAVHEFPVVFPVNYRLVETSAAPWIALRTRPGNIIDHAPLASAFEIDGHYETRREGWSVLVRGTLERVDPDAAGFRERFDPEPWLTAERESWLAIAPFAISGRRLQPGEQPWVLEEDMYR